MALDQSVYDAILFNNTKAMTDGMNTAVLLATQNAVSNQQVVNTITQTAMAAAVDMLGNTSVPEGLGISAAQSGSLGPLIAALASAIASGQVVTKSAGNTPPVTP